MPRPSRNRSEDAEEFDVPETGESASPVAAAPPVPAPAQPEAKPEAKKPIKTWDDHVPPAITAQSMAESWETQHRVQREMRLEYLARADPDIRWLLDEYTRLTKSAK